MKCSVFLCTLFLGLSVFAGVDPIQEVFSPDQKSFPHDQYAKVAVVAWAPPEYSPLTPDPAVAESVKQGYRKILENYIRQAAAEGAEFVVTPEFGFVGYPDIPDQPPEHDNFQTPEQLAPYAEPIPGTSTEYFGKIATELNIYIQFGMAEAGENGQFHNTVVVVGPDGSVQAAFRKMNLFEIENHYLVAGTTPVVWESPFGKIGFLICADVYHQPLLSAYKSLGVQVLSLSSSWASYNSGFSNFTTAAMDVGAYLLASNQTYFPDSGVINPDGTAQSHIRQSTGVAYGFLPRVQLLLPLD